MITFLLILLYAYAAATSFVFTVGAIIKFVNRNKEKPWDNEKHWAIQQLFNYYMLSDNIVLRGETEAFLKELGYPLKEMWEEYAPEVEECN